MFALRLRMVRILTVAVFPLLAGLVVLAPVVIPWVFGPDLGAGDRADADPDRRRRRDAGDRRRRRDADGRRSRAGAARRTAGRTSRSTPAWPRSSPPQGLVAVCIGAVIVHLVFLVIAYGVLLQGACRASPARGSGETSPPPRSARFALLAVAVPLNSAANAAQLPVSIHVAVVGAAAALTYLLVLRAAFSAEWHDLIAIGRRLLPRAAAASGARAEEPRARRRCMRSRTWATDSP